MTPPHPIITLPSSPSLPPCSSEHGGPLDLQHVSYVEGRGNLIVTYKGTHATKVMSLVGCHMDVVTANPDDWVGAM